MSCSYIMPLKERLSHLLKILPSPKFLQSLSTGGEIPFYICPFPAHETLEMEELQRHLISQLVQKGIQILEINLYDLVLELMRTREDGDFLKVILAGETRLDKEQLLEQIQNVTDAEKYLMPAIRKKMEANPSQILIISGVGEVFPYIRAHNFLNNLQSTVTAQPVLLFFPGEYTHSVQKSTQLNLFGKFHDDRYYRGFNIYNTHA